MGTCMSSEEDLTREQIDRVPPGKDKEAAMQRLLQREAEEKAARLQSLGIEIPADKLRLREPPSAAFSVNLQLPGCEALQQTIDTPLAPVVLLKLQLYEHPPPGGIVAPPTVSRLTMGGHELLNDDTYADHDVQEGATLMLTSDSPMEVTFRDATVLVWGEERLDNALKRLGFPSMRWMLLETVAQSEESGPFDPTRTLTECGITDGARVRGERVEVPYERLSVRVSGDVRGGGTGREHAGNLLVEGTQSWNKWYSVNGAPHWIEVTVSGPAIHLSRYSLRSANDCPHRDPTGWDIKGIQGTEVTLGSGLS